MRHILFVSCTSEFKCKVVKFWRKDRLCVTVCDQSSDFIDWCHTWTWTGCSLCVHVRRRQKQNNLRIFLCSSKFAKLRPQHQKLHHSSALPFQGYFLFTRIHDSFAIYRLLQNYHGQHIMNFIITYGIISVIYCIVSWVTLWLLPLLSIVLMSQDMA